MRIAWFGFCLHWSLDTCRKEGVGGRGKGEGIGRKKSEGEEAKGRGRGKRKTELYIQQYSARHGCKEKG